MEEVLISTSLGEKKIIINDQIDGKHIFFTSFYDSVSKFFDFHN